MLVAGPGYGKTTLAEQWAAQGRRVAWIRARRSSADVAVLARQMAAAGAEILPGCDRQAVRATERDGRPRRRARGARRPAVRGSGRVAGRRVDRDRRLPAHSGVGDRGGLCRGDRPAIAGAGPDLDAGTAELGVDASVLYGDVLEIGQSLLAMSEDEVEEMLAGARDRMSRPARARRRLAGGDRSREPDDDRVTCPPRAWSFPSSCTSSSRRRSTGPSSRKVGSGLACSRRLQASTASCGRDCSAPIGPSACAPRH